MPPAAPSAITPAKQRGTTHPRLPAAAPAAIAPAKRCRSTYQQHHRQRLKPDNGPDDGPGRTRPYNNRGWRRVARRSPTDEMRPSWAEQGDTEGKLKNSDKCQWYNTGLLYLLLYTLRRVIFRSSAAGAGGHVCLVWLARANSHTHLVLTGCT